MTDATPPAPVAGPITNLEVKVLKISGETFGASATIASDTPLQVVTLATDDPDTGPQGVLSLNPDPSSLGTDEAVVVRANGATIATAFPGARAANLATNAGTFLVLVFSVGGDSYAIPLLDQPLAGVTATTAPSQLNLYAVSGIQTLDYGFLPVGALARRGQVYVNQVEFGTTTVNGSRPVTVYDADDIRANSDSVGDEVGNGLFLRNGEEILANVQFWDNTFGVVRGVRYVLNAAYSYTETSYLFDAAALTAAGKTIADVRAVISAAPTSHGLTWSALGLAP